MAKTLKDATPNYDSLSPEHKEIVDKLSSFAAQDPMKRDYVRFHIEMIAIVCATRNGASDDRLIDIVNALFENVRLSSQLNLLEGLFKSAKAKPEHVVPLLAACLLRAINVGEEASERLGTLIDGLENDFNREKRK